MKIQQRFSSLSNSQPCCTQKYLFLSLNIMWESNLWYHFYVPDINVGNKSLNVYLFIKKCFLLCVIFGLFFWRTRRFFSLLNSGMVNWKSINLLFVAWLDCLSSFSNHFLFVEFSQCYCLFAGKPTQNQLAWYLFWCFSTTT